MADLIAWGRSEVVSVDSSHFENDGTLLFMLANGIAAVSYDGEFIYKHFGHDLTKDGPNSIIGVTIPYDQTQHNGSVYARIDIEELAVDYLAEAMAEVAEIVGNRHVLALILDAVQMFREDNL